jgi:hypothetical protein
MNVMRTPSGAGHRRSSEASGYWFAFLPKQTQFIGGGGDSPALIAVNRLNPKLGHFIDYKKRGLGKPIDFSGTRIVQEYPPPLDHVYLFEIFDVLVRFMRFGETKGKFRSI